MLERLAGILCILLAGYEFYSVKNLFNTIKTKGNKSTSPFVMVSLWTAMIFGVALLAIGVGFLFKMI